MLHNLRPSLCVSSVANLYPEDMLACAPNLGIVILDVHNTTTNHAGDNPSQATLNSLERMHEAQLRLGMMSVSSNPARARRTHQIAEGISTFLDYEIPVVTTLTEGRGGSFEFRDKPLPGKPFRPIFDAIIKLMDPPPGQQIFYVGDQLFKDVWGANRRGLKSALVAPYSSGGHWGVRFLQRPAEALARPFIGQPFFSANIGRPNNQASRNPKLD